MPFYQTQKESDHLVELEPVKLSNRKYSEQTISTEEKSSPPLSPADIESGKGIDDFSFQDTQNNNESFNYFDSYDSWEEQNSPIEVVRATVSNIDQPDLPQLTFRFWVLSTFYIILASTLNGYFYFRFFSSFYFGLPFVQLTSYVLGRLMALTLPTKRFEIAGFAFSLNPGPFNIKEHALIGVAGGVAGDYPAALDLLMTMNVYYQADFGTGFAILLLFTTQLLGYGVVGILLGILVDSAVMIWPQALIWVTFYNTLHETRRNFSRNLSRSNFFFVVFAATAVYQFLPSLVMPILSSMAILCWINPSSIVFQNLGSGYSGVGILDLSFDWSALSSVVQPLWTPFWAQANFYFGLIVVSWIIVPVMWGTNFWQSKLLPIVSEELFSSSGTEFDPTTIYNSSTGVVNQAAVDAQSPFLLSPSFALFYGISFLGAASAISQFWLYNWRDVLNRCRGRVKEDIHTRLMKSYAPVPQWWFGIIFFLMIALVILMTIIFKDLLLPWWASIIAVFFMLIMILPIGVIQALSGLRIGTNVLNEVVAGYIVPGRPFANMVFKMLGYNTMYQGIQYLQYAKLGHYLKLDRRKLFFVQIYATSISAVLTWIVTKTVFSNNMNEIMAVAAGLSETNATNLWTTDAIDLFYTSSVIYGIIRPSRIFGEGSIYHPLLWCFIIGLVFPVPFYILHTRYARNHILPLINIPIIALGAATIPETSANWVTTAMMLGFFMQYYVYRHRHEWWKKYNYVLAASLDAATQVTALFVFCAITSSDLVFPQWWGNSYSNPERCGSVIN